MLFLTREDVSRETHFSVCSGGGFLPNKMFAGKHSRRLAVNKMFHAIRETKVFAVKQF